MCTVLFPGIFPTQGLNPGLLNWQGSWDAKKAKWLSEEALQIAEKRRSEKQRRKGKIHPSECRVPKNSKER